MNTSVDRNVPTAEKVQLSDEEVVERVLGGDVSLFEVIMRRYNTRLYRVARSILRNDAEAEDVMQDAYVKAYEHLGQFEGRAQFSTWLTRIAVHEALRRVRKSARFEDWALSEEDAEDRMNRFPSKDQNPEQQISNSEAAYLLEQAIQELPDGYRAVYMLRDVEEMNTAETAATLGLTEDNVKVRLYRARAVLRRHLYSTIGSKAVHAFQFHAVRCDRVVSSVLDRIQREANFSH
jgi:RNA polymerase sigma-70 factor (ECF subfamily)